MTKVISRFLLASTTILLLASCQPDDGKKDIKSYYFPLDSLSEGRVYEYRVTSGTEARKAYWYYKTIREEGRSYLIGMAYDDAFSPDQFVREERVDNGMLLSDFIAYETDTATGLKIQIPAMVEQANVFPFKVSMPAGVLLSSVRWTSSQDSSVYSFTRNRQYLKDTSIVFKGQQFPAVLFNVRELVDHEQEGHWQQEYPVTEIYARGLGLAFTEKRFSDSLRLVYQLEDIYSMERFEEKFKKTLGQQ
ncbi:MAG: hypothetical protein RI973_211 [Bacteroidota bacterium]